MEVEQVVRIYETITVSERQEMFIVMEYCEGGNLLQWIKRNRRHRLINQTVSEPASVCVCICERGRERERACVCALYLREAVYHGVSCD